MAFKMNLGRPKFKSSINAPIGMLRNSSGSPISAIDPVTGNPCGEAPLPPCNEKFKVGEAVEQGESRIVERDGQRFRVQDMRQDYNMITPDEVVEETPGGGEPFVVRNDNKAPNDEWVDQLTNQICTPEGKAANPARYKKLCTGDFDLTPDEIETPNYSDNLSSEIFQVEELLPEEEPEPIPGFTIGTTGGSERRGGGFKFNLPEIDLNRINPLEIVSKVGDVVFTKSGG